jgi:hypothetical protein
MSKPARRSFYIGPTTEVVRRPIMKRMNSQQPIRRWVLVDRSEPTGGVRRMRLAPVTGVVPIASSARGAEAKSAERA